ncbi:hypothetical protein Q8F55_007398 [Vanrija albida]|uniref:Cytochrome P450 n=1 Tax=Vanrija albida TaxID=181172 RepID=A0ABR3PTG1_9TREE
MPLTSHLPSVASLLPSSAAWLLAALSLALALWAYAYPYTARTLPFRNLPGPAPPSVLFGSLLAAQSAGTYGRWAATHGPTLRFRALLGAWRIASTDPVAVAHVLANTHLFHRQAGFNALLLRMFGPGVLMVEGEAHRRQRRALGTAFSAEGVRRMMPVLWDAAYALAQRLGEGEAELHDGFMRTAIEAIARAGFSYDLRAGMETNPLSRFLFLATHGIQRPSISRLLQISYPALLALPTAFTRAIDAHRRAADEVGRAIVAARRAELREAVAGEAKGDDGGRDALSRLLKANTSELDEKQRLSDAEVLAQIGALMLAGNESSASALSWACLHLAQHPGVQARLRAELDAVPDDRPGLDELAALPYLDAVVREVLRVDAPLPHVVRTCVRGAVVPLGVPIGGRDGRVVDSVRVPRGTEFVIPISEINKSTAVWGPDAAQFNPDRYARDARAADAPSVPGIWGNLLTFLAGPHNCMGYRFALAEIKAVLFVLLRSFTLEPLPSAPRIERRCQGFVQRPFVAGEEEKGIQLPVVLRRRVE